MKQLIITAVIFTAYWVYVRLKLGYFPKSLSVTVKEFKTLFTLMISAVATSLLIYSYNTVTDELPLLAVGSLGFFAVGVFSIAIKKVTIIHYLAAIIGFGFSLVSVWLDYGYFLAFIWSVIVSLIVFIISNKKSRIWWLEIVLAYCLFLSLLLL